MKFPKIFRNFRIFFKIHEFHKIEMMSKHEKIPRRKRKSFYTNSYSKIRVKEDLIADKLQVS